MTHTNHCGGIARFLPKRIGGPGTRLPRIVESLFSWAFSIGCLGVALWHYQIDRYRTRIESGPTEISKSGDPQSQQKEHHHRLRLPLTTHSRRELLTVSESYRGLRTRYHQLLEVIYALIIVTETKQPNEEKKDGQDGELLNGNRCAIVDGKICRMTPSQKQEEKILPVGEAVAEWLSSGIVTSTFLKMPLSTEKTKIIIRENSYDDKGDSLHCRDSYEILIGIIRTNHVARRLASLLLGQDPIEAPDSSTNRESKEKWLNRLSAEEPGADVVLRALQEIWSRLLQLPASLPPAHEIGCNDNIDTIHISVIVPAFREDGRTLAAKLQCSMQHAIELHRIEIIVVHVVEKKNEGTCDNLSQFTRTLREELLPTIVPEDRERSASSRLPKLRILEYDGGGGRGPCLNYGAKHARGSILTFLHSDTRLVAHCWDKLISKSLENDGSDRARTTCCAFSFAIDTSPEALTVQTKETLNLGDCNESNHYRRYYPPGLHAIEVTANLRCKLFALPYGDQCLSLPTAVFRYVGGYPDQCLMEDYELIRLLRMRSAASLMTPSTIGLGSNCSRDQEMVEIFPGHKALCSPRRWQKHGVLYVTYMNSYCVKRYNNGELTPDEIFCMYYGTTAGPNRMGGERSPWEAGLQA